MADLLIHGPAVAGSKSRRKTKSRNDEALGIFRLVQGAGNAVLSWRGGPSRSERNRKRRMEERRQILIARMENAEDFRDWESAAKIFDQIEGNDAWKLNDESDDPEYRPDLIRAKLQALDAARASGDVRGMMYLIRTALSRDLGGMGSAALYRHSYIGTKALVERYVDSALETIRSVIDMSLTQTEMDPRELLEGIVYARQSFGRTALLLSGGATFGMAHIGVLKTLYEQQLLPRIISGASAGSIVCAVLCTRKDEEVPTLIKAFPFGDLSVFSGPNETLSDHVRTLLTKGSWADISNLTRVMRLWLGDVTFQEAYNRTRRICNICVSSASMYDAPRLLNYVTAPNVLIWSAVAASCSVPLVFQAHTLMMKDPNTGAHEPWIPSPQHFIDGSVDNDLPMTRLAEMFNVTHFIVSQVNPHVVPFLPRDERVAPGQLHQDQAREGRSEFIKGLAAVALKDGLHRVQFLAEMGVFPNLLTKLLSVMSQKYSGDINIIPEIPLSEIPYMLRNPTSDFMQRNCRIGERATWPKLSRIRHRLAIELALNKAVHAVRAAVVFSRSQVELRRAMGVTQPMIYRPGELPTSETGHLSPWSRGASPEEERAIQRRRGSGASIQLAAARHMEPVFQDAAHDESGDDDEDERLELKLHPRRAARLRIRGGNGANLTAPRLKRNAKSHGHMRGGRPADFIRGELLLPKESPATARADPATAAVAEEEAGRYSPTAEAFSIGLDVALPLEDDESSQASDGGLLSDPDPYAAAASGRLRLPNRRSQSKLRHSES